MAGKRERQKETRERGILRAAERLFKRWGYAGTSLEQVAERAGLAVGTLYNYFPSKAELLATILRQDTDTALSAGETILKDPPADPSAAVAALLDLYAGLFTLHDRGLWREVLAAALANPDTLGSRLMAEDVRLIAQLTALIRELQARRLVSQDRDPGRAAITLYSVCLGWIMAFIASDHVSIEAMRTEIRHGIDMVMDGLTVDRREGRAR